MKPIKYLTLLLIIVLITECDKEEECDCEEVGEYELQFGDIQKGFLIDSVYQTDSNGFLYVQFEAISSSTYVSILSDQNPEPSTEIARIYWEGL